MNQIKTYVVGSGLSYAGFIKNHQITKDIEEAEVVVFTGGEDISPEFYGQETLEGTYANKERDLYEISMYKKVKNHQLCVGICRGAQLACILNGGILVQDVNNHARFHTHTMRIHNFRKDDMLFDITSIHHQMMYPYDMPSKNYKVVATAYPRKSTFYKGISSPQQDNIIKKGEPEVILFRKPDNPLFLAIQGHPEIMCTDSPTVTWLNREIKFLLNTLKKN